VEPSAGAPRTVRVSSSFGPGEGRYAADFLAEAAAAAPGSRRRALRYVNGGDQPRPARPARGARLERLQAGAAAPVIETVWRSLEECEANRRWNAAACFANEVLDALPVAFASIGANPADRRRCT